MQNTYFLYFGHGWLHTPKMIVSTYRRLWCLSACQKIDFAIHGIGGKISITILVFIIDYLQEKLMTKFKKKLFWGHFVPFLLKFGQKWIFLEKRLQQILNIPVNFHHAKNQTDWQTDRQTDRQWWLYRTLHTTGIQKRTWAWYSLSC